MIKTNSFIKGILNNKYIKVYAEDQVPRKAGDAELRVYVKELCDSESGFFIERIRGNKVIDFSSALYDKYSLCSYTSICICDEGEPIEDCRIERMIDILHNELEVLFVPYIFNPIKLTTFIPSSYYPITRSYL